MLFQYAQLAPNTIRLVEVDSNSTDSDIHLTLSHQPDYFSSSVHYEALWYPSDEQDASRKTLILNGRTMSIPSQAWDAISAVVKNHKKGVKYWIDAVCVFRRDEAEKKWHQSQLNRIYSSADRVYLWLGPSDETVERAFRTVQNRLERGQGEVAAVKAVAQSEAFIEASRSPAFNVSDAVLLCGDLECDLKSLEEYRKALPASDEATAGAERHSRESL